MDEVNYSKKLRPTRMVPEDKDDISTELVKKGDKLAPKYKRREKDDSIMTELSTPEYDAGRYKENR